MLFYKVHTGNGREDNFSVQEVFVIYKPCLDRPACDYHKNSTHKIKNLNFFQCRLDISTVSILPRIARGFAVVTIFVKCNVIVQRNCWSCLVDRLLAICVDLHLSWGLKFNCIWIATSVPIAVFADWKSHVCCSLYYLCRIQKLCDGW